MEAINSAVVEDLPTESATRRALKLRGIFRQTNHQVGNDIKGGGIRCNCRVETGRLSSDIETQCIGFKTRLASSTTGQTNQDDKSRKMPEISCFHGTSL